MCPAEMVIKSLETESDFERAVQSHSLVHFFASWYEPCADMDALLEGLAPKAGSLTLARVGPPGAAQPNMCAQVDSEALQEISARYKISSVPTFVVFKVPPPHSAR